MSDVTDDADDVSDVSDVRPMLDESLLSSADDERRDRVVTGREEAEMVESEVSVREKDVVRAALGEVERMESSSCWRTTEHQLGSVRERYMVRNENKRSGGEERQKRDVGSQRKLTLVDEPGVALAHAVVHHLAPLLAGHSVVGVVVDCESSGG